MTLRVLALRRCADPAPGRGRAHPRREGDRGAEAFPRAPGGLLQAAQGEGGETVRRQDPGENGHVVVRIHILVSGGGKYLELFFFSQNEYLSELHLNSDASFEV